jgi:cytochrome c oxidase subunit 4
VSSTEDAAHDDHDDHDHDDEGRDSEPEAAHGHDHKDPGLAHHAAHGATKKEIWTVFVVLIVLTGLELGVVYLRIGKWAMITALIGLALAKAYTVAMYYMHLKGETKIMKFMVYLPMMFPALYAIVLMVEAIARLIGHRA